MIESSGNVGLSLESDLVAMFVQTASRFSSHISVKKGDKIANGKSIMGMISLGVVDGQDVVLIADGEDEQAALAELSKFLKVR